MRLLMICSVLATVSSVALAAPMSECKTRASHNHIGIEDNGTFVDVGYQTATDESSANTGSAVLSVVSLGFSPVKGKVYAVLEGAHADVQLKDRQPVIVDLDADMGSRPGDTIKLVKLNVGKNRSIAVAESSESLISSHSKSAFPAKMVMPIKFEQVEKACLLDGRKVSQYRGVPTKPLEPGEYAIAYGNSLYYTFGVK